MDAAAPDDPWIFLADDNDTQSIWEARLAEAPDAARGRRFQILEEGPLPTALGARASLRAAVNGDYLPDVIVIDHQLEGVAAGDHAGEDSGLGLMRWLTTACAERGRAIPPAVLWSADYSEDDPGLAAAFVDAGGLYAYSRKLASPEFVRALWRIVDGDEPAWAHRSSGPPLPLAPVLVALLPYLEANVSTPEIARRLRAEGTIGPEITDGEGWVNDNRSKLQKHCNKHSEEHSGTRPFVRGQGPALAEYARRHGHSWIPLRYRPDAG